MLKQCPTQPEGDLVIQIVAMPKDTNANGDIFGGWLVSHMDMGSAIAARMRANSRVVTVSIDGMVFHKPVYVGDTVCCYAKLLNVGKTSMKFQIDVWTISFPSNVPKMVAEGLFTFVAIDDQGRPRPVDR